MKAATAVTLALDDIPSAVREITGKIERGMEFCKHSAGILYCDSDMDPLPLLRALEAAFDFPILGCTSIGILDGQNGFNEPCASLTVLSADDCRFYAALSDPVTPGNVEAELERVYAEGAAALGETPKLIYALPSYRLDIMLDIYPEKLGEISGGVPVFGGLPSTNTEGVNAVFAGGQLYGDRVALLLIGGNVRPLFSVKNLLLNLAEQKRTVTSARDNIIYKVGDMTFVDYLKGIGLGVDFSEGADNTLRFVSNPLLVELPQGQNSDGVPVVRTLHGLNLEDGSGLAIAKVPQGSVISVGILRGEEIRGTARQAIDELLEQIRQNEADGYRYSVILCSTCIGRFLAMAPQSGLEGEVLTDAIGEAYTLSGFYSHGEICPTSIKKGRAMNMAHNESITLCAL